MPADFRVYVRQGCHLCEDLLVQLQQLQLEHTFKFSVVDVDSDPLLTERYGLLVPVVMQGDIQVCHYFLDQVAILQALDNTNMSSTKN